MEFIAVITVLAAMQLWGHSDALQRDDWLDRAYARLQSLADYRVRLLLIVVVPVVLVMLAESILEGVMWGLPLLLFYIAVFRCCCRQK